MIRNSRSNRKHAKADAVLCLICCTVVIFLSFIVRYRICLHNEWSCFYDQLDLCRLSLVPSLWVIFVAHYQLLWRIPALWDLVIAFTMCFFSKETSPDYEPTSLLGAYITCSIPSVKMYGFLVVDKDWWVGSCSPELPQSASMCLRAIYMMLVLLPFLLLVL